MKKKLFTLLICALCAVLVMGCGDSSKGSGDGDDASTDSAIENAEAATEALVANLLEASDAKDSDIQYLCHGDYDGDGAEDAFALIGKPSEGLDGETLAEAALWFSGKSGCVKLGESVGMGFRPASREMKIGGVNYLIFDDLFVTQAVSHVWYVSNGKAREAVFSGLGEVVTDLDGEDKFRIMDSSYDSFYDSDIGSMVGHTWKHYYFYYDSSKKKIFEYAGGTTDENVAAKLCGFDIVGELMPADANIESLFTRGNGMVVLNFSYPSGGGRQYCHYIYDFNKGSLVDDTGNPTGKTPLDGTCLASLCPKIAAYPDYPGVNKY